ncbi:Ppx-GppA domain-containing protein [Sulfidibacter corallicola]|uniref:Exopolyphosphatase n=1 Tax=Sulfidibacter corallicola TaxID=2818388 RepID=A0A8A4TEL6_SULCO|nr:hypothetical protein [Sulfidibacter corallicola]QTD47664.1 hypothetical protein J3U87_18890 [Sulfidibacter corallicola]
MPDRRTIATVDLGSNSFHMMIAQVQRGRVTVIDSLREPVRLRMGLQKDGSISQEAQERALTCLARFEQRLRGISPELVKVVGTNALRSSKNSYDFLKRIEETLKTPVDIIGGREEARLIYKGVAQHLPKSKKRNLVIDIGGGSTEFVIGQNLEPHTMESRELGCVTFSMKYFPGGAITRKGFKRALMHVARELERYHNAFSRDNWERAIGASGTCKAIGNAIAYLTSGDNIITMDGLNLIKNRLFQAKKMSGELLPGLREDRIPVFPGGFAILYGIFLELSIEQMLVSSQSLRDGVLYDFLGREMDDDKRVESVSGMMDFYRVDKNQARRVRETALKWFPQVAHALIHRRDMAQKIIGWAADLHEIGLVLAHSGYHKHGGYILLNTDMDGFSKIEQGLLSFAVVNHRKRLKTDNLPYENEFDWPLVFVLRLAVLFNRERRDQPIPEIEIDWEPNEIWLDVPDEWLADHPLTRYDLELEQNYWERIGYTLRINTDA